MEYKRASKRFANFRALLLSRCSRRLHTRRQTKLWFALEEGKKVLFLVACRLKEHEMRWKRPLWCVYERYALQFAKRETIQEKSVQLPFIRFPLSLPPSLPCVSVVVSGPISRLERVKHSEMNDIDIITEQLTELAHFSTCRKGKFTFSSLSIIQIERVMWKALIFALFLLPWSKAMKLTLFNQTPHTLTAYQITIVFLCSNKSFRTLTIYFGFHALSKQRSGGRGLNGWFTNFCFLSAEKEVVGEWEWVIYRTFISESSFFFLFLLQYYTKEKEMSSNSYKCWFFGSQWDESTVNSGQF